MKLHLDTASGNVIQSHAPGKIVVNQKTYAASVIILPNRIIADWPPQRFEDLEAIHFELIAGHGPEILVLGTGGTQRFPRAELTAALINQGVGIEVMDTPAACRTYNVLLADMRNVAAAILMTER